jgi:hypothetical protein
MPLRACWCSPAPVTDGDAWLPPPLPVPASHLPISSSCAPRCLLTLADAAARPDCTPSPTCESSSVGVPTRTSTRSPRCRWTSSVTCAGCRTRAATSPRRSRPGFYRVLRVRGKGGKVVLIPLPPAVARAIDRAVDGRTVGPILRNTLGARIDRRAGTRSLKHLAATAGIPLPRMHPHSVATTETTSRGATTSVRWCRPPPTPVGQGVAGGEHVRVTRAGCGERADRGLVHGAGRLASGTSPSGDAAPDRECVGVVGAEQAQGVGEQVRERARRAGRVTGLALPGLDSTGNSVPGKRS